MEVKFTGIIALLLLGFVNGQNDLLVAFEGVSRYLESVNAPCHTIVANKSFGSVGMKLV